MHHGGKTSAPLQKTPRRVKTTSMRCTLFVFAFVLLTPALLPAAAKKPPPMAFRVHAETSERDTATFAMPVTIINPPMQVFVEKMPFISEREVKAFYAFPTGQGDFGAYFQLDNHGTKAWENLTSSQRGRFLVILFNGRAVARLRVDRAVTDGIVMVPHGITQAEVQAMQAKLPVIGQAASGTRTSSGGTR
jgi:hypothetical protein